MKISYAKANGAIILTAERMGYEVSFVKEANSLLIGEDIQPSLKGHIDLEASRVHNLIAEDNRVDEANKIALELLKSA